MAEPVTPSTARMIDYWLGGRHHFAVDIAAAGAFEQAYGPCAPVFRSLRDFLGRAVRYLASSGVDDFLVFGAGVPTLGNVHEVAPEAHVLYTDVDPAMVHAGQQILAGQKRVGYLVADATDIGGLDAESIARQLPGWGSRPVGVVFLGLAAFLDDGTLAATLDDLYQAVAPGSLLAVDFDSEELAGYPEALEMMGPAFRMRSPAGFAPLLGRWLPTADGIVPVHHWRSDGATADVPDAFYGGVATKPAS